MPFYKIREVYQYLSVKEM